TAGANRNWLLAGAALVAATGIGFTAARLTSPKPPPAAEAKADEGEAGHAEGEGSHAEGEAHADEGGDAEVVAMDDARIKTASIQLQPVAVGGLGAEIRAQATIEAEPSGQAALTARAAGSIARINKRLGDPVRAGETLALVESRDAAQIAADRATATARADLARKMAAREQRLHEQKVGARQDLEAAQASLVAAEAEARRAAAAAGAAAVTADGRYVRVVSPISGRVTAMNASLGAFVQPETELFRIADPSRIQVEAAVSALDVQRIQPGDRAVIGTSGGTDIPAVVRSITPAVDERTRAATVVLSPTGSLADLRPGQLVEVRMTSARSATRAIVVPDEAIQTVEGRSVVFVRAPKGFRAQPVTVGRRTGGRAEILEGLRPGDVIAAANAFVLKAELGKGEAEHGH
ncbi:efflux RND transporter periplasmic adaptor subunit, partial [Phenylobacterium sp.]|uniref:efflux RND transporter periplasmic adaptor subunit n=1 Tax=Phenylobacterium sp. TaxID=1871053 RepID=UPI0025EC82E2